VTTKQCIYLIGSRQDTDYATIKIFIQTS